MMTGLVMRVAVVERVDIAGVGSGDWVVVVEHGDRVGCGGGI